MKTKHFLAAFLACAMAASVLAGCNNSGTEESKPSSSGDSSTEAPEERGPITLTIGGIQSTGTEDFPEGQNYEDNNWRKLYEEELGVTLEYAWVVPAAQKTEKINMSINSGEVPDIMQVDPTQFEQMLGYDMAADLTQVYDQYATELTKTTLSADGGVALQTSSRDGKLYGIPYTSDYRGGTNVFWVRTDWLKNLNMEIPKTTDELYEVAKAFAKNDPDGNGKNDTVGLGLEMSSSVNSLSGIMQSFNAYPDKWVDDGSGKAEFGALNANAEKSINYLAKMYQDGLISKEFVSLTSEKLAESVTSGQCGLVTWAWWAPFWSLNNCKQNNPDADWEAFVVSENGEMPKLNVSKTPGLYYVVSSECEHPEVVVEMTNLFFDMYIGERSHVDGTKYIHNEAGDNFWQFATVYLWSPEEFMDQFNGLHEGIEAKDPSKVQVARMPEYNAIIEYEKSQDPNSYASYTSWKKEGSAFSIFKQASETDSYEAGVYFGTQTETQKSVGAQLDQIVLQGYAKLIAGEAGYTFDDLRNEWKSAGGDKVTEEINAYIAETK